MKDIQVCGKCGVPLYISREFEWESSGTILSTSFKELRWVFLESEFIDSLIRGIEELIGIPLDDIVLESRRRESKYYMAKLWPPQEIRDYLNRRDKNIPDSAPITDQEKEEFYKLARVQVEGVQNIARIYGYGEMLPTDLWERGDINPWRVNILKSSYSVFMNAAVLLGAVEAFEDKEMWADIEETGESSYLVTCYEKEHPVNLKERLRRHIYELKPGDVTYDRCPECGLPEEVSRCNFFTETGIIVDPLMNRRMAIFGPSSVDSILKDLESELGETVPSLVIEAQRRIIKSELSNETWKRRAPDFKRMLSARGLGNLVEFDGDREHLTITIQNSCLTLIMVGTVQALVELAIGWDSSEYEYELKEDGDLIVTINRS